jgi:DnaK suppressor protein
MTTTTSRRLHRTQNRTPPASQRPGPNARVGNQLTAYPQPATAVIAFPVPCWRAVLETQWQYRVAQITELSLAFHTAAERTGYTSLHRAAPELARLQRRTAAARRALANIDDALARLSAGRYGYCEQCGADIPVARLTTNPEARYCPRCSPGRRDQPS